MSAILQRFLLSAPRCLLQVLCLMAITVSTGAGNHPNIILFLVDDMGWQDTSVPFWEKPTPLNQHFRTPNMERLAHQGRRFTQAYACAVCSPTRTSIMTGQNAARHRVTNWTLHEHRETSGSTPRLLPPRHWKKEGLQPGAHPTLPMVLRDQWRYHTIHVGKAHWGAYDTQGSDPLTLGFEVNIAGHAAGGPGHYHGTKNYGNRDQGGRTRPWGIPGLEAYHGSETHLTEALTLEAQKEMTNAVEAGKPFYLYMAHYAVHAPIQPHEKFMPHYRGKKYPGTQLDIPEKEARYASMVEGMDASLGSLMAHATSLGVARETLLIFASDNGTLSLHARGAPPHGEGPNTHTWPLREGKGSAYEGGTRIPLIVSWILPDPSAPIQRQLPIPANTISETQVIVEDFYPSIIHWASGRSPENGAGQVDGMDFTSALLGEPRLDSPLRGRPLVFHYPHQWTGKPSGGYQPHSALRHGDWKAIYFYENQAWQLYDLRHDIGETTDLSGHYPERIAKLARQLKDALENVQADMPLDRATGSEATMILPGR